MANVELPVGISFIPIYSVLFRFYLHDIPKSLLVVGLMFRLPAAYNGPGPSLSCQTSSPFFLWSNSIQTPCSASSFSCSYDQWKAPVWMNSWWVSKRGGNVFSIVDEWIWFDLIWSDLIWFDLIDGLMITKLLMKMKNLSKTWWNASIFVHPPNMKQPHN